MKQHITKIKNALVLAFILFFLAAQVNATATINIYFGDLPANATYTIKTDGTNYWAVRYDGYKAWESTTATTVINNALAAGTGKVLLTEGNYPCATAILMSSDDWLEGENWGAVLEASGSSHDVITIGSDASIVYRARIGNIKITCAAGSSGITGITQWRTAYSVFENIFIAGSNAGNRLQYGWIWKQDTADGDHSWDNFVNNIRILNFYGDGWLIEDWEDTDITNVNIGTELNSNSALRVQAPKAGNAGGSGISVTNLHLWSETGTMTTGLYLGGQYDGTFRTKWVNIWIENQITTGLLFESNDAHSHSFTNLIVSAVTTQISNSGYDNTFSNTKIKSAASTIEPIENSGFEAASINGTAITHGLAATPTSVTLTMYGQNYINSTCCYLPPTLLSMNSTKFIVCFTIFNAGTIKAVSLPYSRTIYWIAVYKP